MLLNDAFIRENILKEETFHRSHSGKQDFLGLGLIYYAIPYMFQAKTCLCLGSGSGFVPRLMRQAQRDLGIANESRTILVDANLPEAGWGVPDYWNKSCFFTSDYDVELIEATTDDAFAQLKHLKVDYIHIDADHSYEHVKKDLEQYSSLLTSNKCLITMHDALVKSDKAGVWKFLNDSQTRERFEVLNLCIAMGTAIVRIKNG